MKSLEKFIYGRGEDNSELVDARKEGGGGQGWKEASNSSKEQSQTEATATVRGREISRLSPFLFLCHSGQSFLFFFFQLESFLKHKQSHC